MITNLRLCILALTVLLFIIARGSFADQKTKIIIKYDSQSVSSLPSACVNAMSSDEAAACKPDIHSATSSRSTAKAR